MYKKLCPDDRLTTGHIICIRSGVFIVPTTISPLYLFLELLVLRILLLRLEAGDLSLAGGRCSISLIEGIAIVDHHVERTGHHVAEFEVAGVEMLLSDNFELGDVVPRALNMMIYYRDAFYQAYAATPTGKAELERMQAQQGK